MTNVFRIIKYSGAVILIIAAIWLISKKSETREILRAGEIRSNDISGFDRIMIGLTGLMEEFNPSSPFTKQMVKQKNTFINH